MARVPGWKKAVSPLIAAAMVPALGCVQGHAEERRRGGRSGGADAGQVAGSDAGRGARGTSCLDRWLEGQHLNEYGDPPGTVYAGGTPLFDERTGQRRTRAEYVFSRHPEAKKACPEEK